jgi:hypothetical protein
MWFGSLTPKEVMMKKIDRARDPIGYALYIENFVRRARRRRQRNNSIPVIRDRILQILSAADGGRLKRSQLTGKLANLGSSRQERRVEALTSLEAAGKIRREAGWSNGHRHDVWALAPVTGHISLQPDGEKGGDEGVAARNRS